MAGENAENKVEGVEETPDTSKELAEINASITSLQQQLKESSKSAQEKIEISKKISELEEQKNSILKNSQTEKANLGDDVAKSKEAGLTQTQEKKLETALDNANLSTSEKAKVEDAIKTNDINKLGIFNIEGGSIWGIIIALFSTFFGTQSAEYEGPYIDGSKPISDKEKKAFAETAKKEALKIQEKYGIPWEVSLAQCILESGWGQSKLAREDGNYFGIKGEGSLRRTQEDYGNGLQYEMASFRRYKNLEESFEGYAQFLMTNPRYKNAFNYGDKMMFSLSKNYQGRDPIQFLVELKKAMYATDSEYVKKVTNVINSLKKSDI